LGKPNNLNKIGNKNKVKKVDDTSPQMTKGRWISESGPFANNSGIKPFYFKRLSKCVDFLIETDRRFPTPKRHSNM